MSDNSVITSIGGAAGEINTASNQGVGGVGIYKQKTGVDIELKNINAGSNKITVVDDVANNEIDVDLAEANILHDNLSGSGQSRAVKVYQTVAQSISTTVWSKITTLNTALFDLSGDFDLVNSKFIPSRAGKYFITATAHITNMTSGSYVWMGIYKNGTSQQWSPLQRTGAAGTTGASAGAIVDMNGSTDYAEVYVKQNSGAAQNTQAGASYTVLYAYFLEG